TDGRNHLIDEFRPVVQHDDVDTIGKRGQRLLELVAKLARHGITVFADPHETQPQHDLPLPVGGHQPFAHFVSDHDVGDVGDVDWHSFFGGHDDFFNLRNA